MSLTLVHLLGRTMRTYLIAGLLLAGPPLVAQTPVTIQLTSFATGLSGIVDIAHAGDERLFVVQRNGAIRIVQPNGTVLPTPFINLNPLITTSGSEQGLLGLAFDPDYANNGYFYVNYTASGGGATRVVRYQVSTDDPNVADPSTAQILLTVAQPYSNHNAGDLDFGPDGYLYIPLGDGGSGGDPQNNAQNLSNLLGDLLRIDVSGGDSTYTIPPDNPYANSGGSQRPEIWASGLRNPWRFGFDALTGDMWIGDVGQDAYEEIDLYPAGAPGGANFGWRCYEGNTAYNTSGCGPFSSYVAPVSVHAHTAQNWCSIIGGRVYRGSVSQRLYGRYIYTDHCGGQFYSLHPDGQGGWIREQVRNQSTYGFTCIGENNEGELFVGNMNNGVLYRIEDPCPMAAPVIEVSDNVLTSSPGSSYQWYLNGSPINGATGQSYIATESGTYHVVTGGGAGCELASEPVVYTNTTSINTLVGTGILVYPVPATDRLVVEGQLEQVASLQLLDVAGRTVLTVAVNGASRVELATGGLANGRFQLSLLGYDGLRLGQQAITIQH
jgi:glucose/arabinose dehydrogenase